jgi:hypothetical protein
MKEHEPVTTYATATDTPMHSQPKQGSRCCERCCDYRRAVIILNFVLVISGIISVIGYTQGIQAIQAGDLDFYDDDLLAEIEDTYRQQAVLTGLGVFASIVAIVGAYRYNVYMVGFNVLYIMIANFIATIVLTNKAWNTLGGDYNGEEDFHRPIGMFVFEAVFLLVYIYPHVGFMSGVRAGILSAETPIPEKNHPTEVLATAGWSKVRVVDCNLY